MRRFLFLVALLALPVHAQQQAQRPLPEEVAFARLDPALQAMLGHLSPGEALRQVEFARQNLIALGQPDPTREQMRRTVQAVLGGGSSVQSASAGETPLPPLSPLVAPPPPAPGR